MKKIKDYLDITEAECVDIVRAAWQKINGKMPNRKNVTVLELGTERTDDWTVCKIWCKVYCKEYDIKCNIFNCMDETLVSSPEINAVFI